MNSSSHPKGDSQTPSSNTSSVFEKYRTFLVRNRIFLRFLEDGLSKLVLYAPSRFVAHSEEELDQNVSPSAQNKILPESLYAVIHLWSLLNDTLYHGFGKGNGLTVGNIDEMDVASKNEFSRKFVIICRLTLSMLECIAPALEVSAYSSRRYRNHQTIQERYVKTLEISNTFERIKFVCRVGILMMNYWKQCSTTTGILQNGGMLDPEGEHHDSFITSSKSEEYRIKKLLYVGPRSGRTSRRTHVLDSNHRHDTHDDSMDVQPLNVLDAPRARLAMLVLGEILHVYRPLYYIHSSLKQEKSSDSNMNKRLHQFKSWIISLCMDLLSQKLIMISKSRSLVFKDGCHLSVDTSSHSTKEELYRRKLRLVLYLLRAPIWDSLTRPGLMHVGSIVRSVPFVGESLVQYCFDMLEYCKKWHFMMEG
jgi:hypothetical protein